MVRSAWGWACFWWACTQKTVHVGPSRHICPEAVELVGSPEKGRGSSQGAPMSTRCVTPRSGGMRTTRRSSSLPGCGRPTAWLLAVLVGLHSHSAAFSRSSQKRGCPACSLRSLASLAKCSAFEACPCVSSSCLPLAKWLLTWTAVYPPGGGHLGLSTKYFRLG